MKDPRRRFTKRQAELRLVVCGGKCERCGVALSDGFHMHHLVRHADGGQTTLLNGIAVCPGCHREIHNEEKN